MNFVRTGCTLIIGLALFTLFTHLCLSQETHDRWWPIQEKANGIVLTRWDLFESVTDPGGTTWAHMGPTAMMVQSMAGLAAQAVNEGLSDEMIFVDSGSADDARWYASLMARLALEARGTFRPWELVDRYKQLGIIHGYILYSHDYSSGDYVTERSGSDHSINVATTAAGMLGGIIISEGLESTAQSHGLNLLFDARGKKEAWWFESTNAGPNMLENPGAEYGSTWPEGWLSSAQNVVWDNTQAHEGSYSFLIDDTSPTDSGDWRLPAQSLNEMSSLPLSWWWRAENLSGEFQIHLRFYDSADQFLGQGTFAFPTGSQTQWRQDTLGTVAVPEGASKFDVWFVSWGEPSTGKLWIDDIEVRSSLASTPQVSLNGQQINQQFALAQDPQIPQNRDIAVAHRMMVFFSMDEPVPTLLNWMNPLSSVLGWNAGGEGDFVSQLTRAGHMLLPSNWANNLSTLSMGSHERPASAFQGVDPNTLDWEMNQPLHAYVLSDGDNVQWYLTSFFSNTSYWANPQRGDFSFGWGAPYGCLDQAAPDALLYMQQTQTANHSVNLHASYVYPDLLGADKTSEQRQALLETYADRISSYMTRSNGKILMFICMDLDSPQAMQAYQIFAQRITPLTAMFAFQYYPYHAGDGSVYWVNNGDNVEIPVITAKYSMWRDLNMTGAGEPADIADWINQNAQSAQPGQLPMDWTIVHAWSDFFNPDNASQTARGLSPTNWSIARVDSATRIVSPEELVWRLRMQHDPTTTQDLLDAMVPCELSSMEFDLH